MGGPRRIAQELEKEPEESKGEEQGDRQAEQKRKNDRRAFDEGEVELFVDDLQQLVGIHAKQDVPPFNKLEYIVDLDARVVILIKERVAEAVQQPRRKEYRNHYGATGQRQHQHQEFGLALMSG